MSSRLFRENIKFIMNFLFKFYNVRITCIRNKKRLFIIIALCVVIITMYYLIFRKPERRVFVDLPFVIVHFDMKGMPPSLSYLTSILPLLKSLGANGLLMEYEDMFPYEGNLRNLSSKYAYPRKDLSEFLIGANKLGFEIIPLVQTFGHMEYALKLQEFAKLRENPYYAESICPSNAESRMLIKCMLQQIVHFHRSIIPLNHFHIGCDEVYNINTCPSCKDKNVNELVLFNEHINNVYTILKAIHPNASVLMWDDMIDPIIKTANQLKAVEPVHWHYSSDINNVHIKLNSHKTKFANTWIATAFKGADGKTSALPDLKARFRNNYGWLKLMYDYRSLYRFKGIILTGWSRYSHMDPPCEILPASMPSLILNLLLVRKFRNGFDVDKNKTWTTWSMFYDNFIKHEFKKELKCTKRQHLNISYEDVVKCPSVYKGAVEAMYEFEKSRSEISRIIYDDDTSLYSVDYYNNQHMISRNFYFSTNTVQSHLNSLETHKKAIEKVFLKYFDNSSIAEYIDYKTSYLKKQLTSILSCLRSFTNVRTWQRRGD